MRLTLFTDYSLRTLMYLLQHPDRVCTAREIAEKYNISLNHIVKVVHKLSQLGFIDSMKGKNGGIKLSREPEKINLWHLIKGLEPDFTLVECFNSNDNTCLVVSACGLKSIFHEAALAFANTLEKYSLADAVAKPQLFAELLIAEKPKK